MIDLLQVDVKDLTSEQLYQQVLHSSMKSMVWHNKMAEQYRKMFEALEKLKPADVDRALLETMYLSFCVPVPR